MKWIEVEKSLRKTGLRVFSSLDLERIFNASTTAVRFFTYRYAKKGYFVRVKRGLYSLADSPPSDLELANKLYSPSYISFEYALNFYNMIPEAVYSITSATTKPTREFECLGRSFLYYSMQRAFFQGYHPEKIQGVTVLIADPEKAIMDYLYFQMLRKKSKLDRVLLRNFSRKKLISYAKIFNKRKLLVLLKNIL